MAGVLEHFKDLADPRRDHLKRHLLTDIIFITICAVICGADDWYEVEEYGLHKEAWLRTLLQLPNGIPSHDTFNRLFSLLDTQAVQGCFASWVNALTQKSGGQLISIDGKRMCNSGQQGSKAVIHMVSAWSNANNMVLAQYKVDDKSNEITAIPALLDMLTVQGCLITIDAMGCQKDIAEKIVDKQADYILAVKENQAFLYDDVREAFEQTPAAEKAVQLTMDHGRIEERTCRVIGDVDWVCKGKGKKDEEDKGWQGLQTLIAINSKRTLKASGKIELQTRYYISSRAETACFFNDAVRQHWGIENKLHWVLDVAFGEDGSTKRAGVAAENFSYISKIALNLLNANKCFKGKRKVSTKIKRKKAGWDDQYLQEILTG